MFSHSKVDAFMNCPYQYYLRYVLKLETIPDCDPQSALILGTAMHTALEKGIDAAEREYYGNYPIIEDKHISEMIKLEAAYEAASKIMDLFKGEKTFEIYFEDEEYNVCGFIDCLVENPDGTYTMLDFKYSNNIEKYEKSDQLAIYKFFAERQFGIKIKKCFFLVIYKDRSTQLFEERIELYRLKLREELKEHACVTLVEPQVDSVDGFLEHCKLVEQATEFPKIKKFCRWCDYRRYCKSDGMDLTEIVP